jgi:hypothetical protein
MKRKITFVMVLIILTFLAVQPAAAGVDTANGWYEGEEIYYIDQGIEEGVTELGENQIYLIGGNRLHQAQVVLFIPGEPSYSPHWNANLVQTTYGTTVQDILDYDGGSLVSTQWPEALFDDTEDLLAAEAAGLVTINRLGVVVLCPVVNEEGAEAPGNVELGILEPFSEWDDYNVGF